MKDKEFKRHMAYEALVLLGMLALLLFITRLWPILLLVILGIFIATLRLLFLSCTKVEPLQPVLALPEPQKPKTPQEQDVQQMGYWVIQNRITQILAARFPDSRWVWENPRAREDILQGNKVYILLNRAGGYRRGLVVIQNLQVMDILFETDNNQKQDPAKAHPAENQSGEEPEKKDIDQSDPDDEEEIPEDFGLMAFEWVNAHVMELNERVNEAFACLKPSILIPAQELPIEDSWPDICKELERNDLPGASCQNDGIIIEFER